MRLHVAEDVRRALLGLVEQTVGGTAEAHAPIEPSGFAAILERTAQVTRIWSGPAFCFPRTLSTPAGTVLIEEGNAHLLRPLLHEWMSDIATYRPTLVLMEAERAVALCCSVRRTDDAHEAGVETAPMHRGRGYAALVTMAWASAVRGLGRVPIYSTSWQNAASRTVARKLGLICFGSDMHIT